MKIFVKTKPQAREVGVEKIDDEHFIVSVKEAPEHGRANTAVIKALAKHFDVSNSQVEILAGHTARNKIISIVC